MRISSGKKIISARINRLVASPGVLNPLIKAANRLLIVFYLELELRNKISLPRAEALTRVMDIDADVEDALVSLGYPRREAKNALSKLGEKPEKWEKRLKEALKLLSK